MLAALNALHTKSDILASYGVNHTADLSDNQLQHICTQLQKQLNSRKIKPVKEVDPEIRKWRSVCLDLLTRMGIYTDASSWPRVNSFLEDKRIAGNTLNKLNIIQLKVLSEKLRIIHTKRQKKINDEDRKALLN